jgi:DNA (cytosine-5)-methyltransferase 1
VSIVAGVDAWDAAKNAFTKNFPQAKFFQKRLEDLSPSFVKKAVGRIDLILASPECRSHSPAKGAAKRGHGTKKTAFQIIRFAKTLKPRWIVVENVVSMRRWSRYKEFRRELAGLGYKVREQSLNAAHFGVPQQRRRLFLLCDKKAEPANVRPSAATGKTASSVLDKDGTYRLSPLRKKKRAAATLQRARRAIAAVGDRRPFLLVYYGSDRCGGWQRLSRPLRTITTLDRFALVTPRKGVHVMRMLQVAELKRAMGMPNGFALGECSRRQRIHLIGNAVCPPVMRAIVRSLTRAS